MVSGSLCAMGGMTPYPVLSALDHFPEDFGLAKAVAESGVKKEHMSSSSCGSGNCACKTSCANPFDDTDYGTPLRHADIDVTLEIDGASVTVPAGTSVMRAAIEAGVNVPKLCATDSLEPFGSCRLCLVEIEGKRGYPASCTTPVEAGMKVRTQTDKLQSLRKNVMELYISDHPLDCLTCPANGDCELQDMAGVVGLREVRYGYEGANHLKDKKDESNPYFTYDASKCIVCNRCVRACEETQGTFALTIAGRGFESRVAASENQPFMESECVSCGACVAACPTATLQEKTVIMLGQAEHSGRDDLRVLRRRLFAQGRDEGQRGRAHGAEQERPGERRPRLREGPLRVGLRHAQGPHHQADDPREDHRSVARSELGRSDHLRGERIPPHSGQARRAIRSAASHRRAARTRKPTSCRNSCARRSATTTSIPAHASATRRPAMA